MDDVIASYLWGDAADPAVRQALAEALDRDPSLAEALRNWRQVCGRLAETTDVPERQLLVLQVVGDRAPMVLTEAERATLDAAQAQLDRALEAHPQLHEVVARIEADADAFERCWMQHMQAKVQARRADRQADRQARAPRRRLGGVRWVWRVGVAAAVVGFAVVLALVVQRDANQVTLTAEPGQVRVVDLADGSQVRLMGGSTITYADPEAAVFNRRVQLDGRAFFDIALQDQGFIVETATAEARVLGTRFGVQATEQLTEVVLETGRLVLAPRGAPQQLVTLDPGQMSRVVARSAPSAPIDIDVAEALGWTGLFIFRATPLPNVAEMLSRHYGISVTVAPELAVDSINGEFSHDDALRDILTTFSQTLGARLQETEEGGFVLTPNE